MKFGNAFRSAVAALGMGVTAAVAQASPLHFFGNLPTASGSFPADPSSAPRAAATLFSNSVAMALTETFETRPVGLLSGTGNAVSAFSNGSIVQAAVPTIGQYLGAGISAGEAPTTSGRFNTTNGAASGRWLETELSFTVNIGASVGAFSFFGTDFGDFDGRLEIELFNGSTSVLANAFTTEQGTPLQPGGPGQGNAQNGSLFFFGYASETLFDRMVFRVGQGAGIGAGDWDYLGFDDLQVGNLRVAPPNGVPEPGSLALAGLALLAASSARLSRLSGISGMSRRARKVRTAPHVA